MSSLKKNFVYNTLYQILVLFLPLVTTPYLTRVIGSDGIGTYSYHFSVAKYFVLFAMLGVNNYGNRAIASVRDDRDELNKTFSEIFIMQLITAITSLGIYTIYAIALSDTMAIVMVIYVAYATIDINWFFFGIEEFKIPVARNAIVKLISVSLIFIFVKSKDDVYTYGLILAGSFLIGQILTLPFLKRYVTFKISNWNRIRIHFKQNLILFVPVIAVSLYKTMDKIMLGNMATMDSVGFYESSESIINIPIALVTSLGAVMLPKMSNLAAKKMKKESQTYIKKSLVFAFFMSTSMSFGIIAISREFVPAFFGNGFEICVALFGVLAPSCIFMAVANVIRTQYLIPNQKDKKYIVSVILGAVVNLVINTLLIPKYDSIGAAIGTLLAEAVVCIYQVLSIRKELNLLPSMLKGIPFILSGILMWIILSSFSFLSLNAVMAILLKVVIGAATYFGILYLLLFVEKHIFKKEIY